ncbi:putative ankyrin repeat protein RF_0381 [Halyomorpha halys]|uniref:putative ankyrin repeat protein RF_0381 n=1 Tax=Halyomorpha halys TaxID=286706 RepID=UPI0006D51A17
MPTIDCEHKTLVSILCPNVSVSTLQAGIQFGAASYHYALTTPSLIEQTSTHALLLSLINGLVNRDMDTYTVLAECSHRIQQLRSQKDMQVAMAQFDAIESSDDFTQELEKAVAENSACGIISIATKGGNVNGTTQSGGSLIHLAVRTGSTSSIAALGFLKADLEVLNVAGATPMEEAIKHNCVPSIKGLISGGADVKRCTLEGNSYLHISAAAGKNRALQALLEAGLDPNTKNDFGDTPLVLAVRGNNVQGTEILLQRVGHPSVVTEMEKDLLKMVVISSNVDIFNMFLKYKILSDIRFENSDTLAHLIVRSSNSTDMLKELKGHRQPFNIKNGNGLAPLHIATNPSIVRTLLDLGADVNFTTEKGETALHIASADESLEVVQVLVQGGAGINIQDDNGVTALMIAAKTQTF